jgi:DNA-binding MarR family transcriptional regulator
MPAHGTPRRSDAVAPRAPSSSIVHVPYIVGRLDRVVHQLIEAAVKQHDVSVSQLTVLSVLGNRSGLSNAQLARRALVSPQSMNEVLLALERRGLVTRRAHPEHGRVRQAALTTSGRAVLSKCDAEVRRVEDEVLAGLNDDERSELKRLLLHCVQTLHGGLSGPAAG